MLLVPVLLAAVVLGNVLYTYTRGIRNPRAYHGRAGSTWSTRRWQSYQLTGRNRNRRAVAMIRSGYSKLSVPRNFPANELRCTVEWQHTLSPSAAFSFANNVSAFQGWSFGGALDGTDCKFYTDATDALTTAQSIPAQTIRNYTNYSDGYKRVAILGSTYYLRFMADGGAAPMTFTAFLWESDPSHDLVPIKALDGTSFGVTDPWGADANKMLDALRAGQRRVWKKTSRPTLDADHHELKCSASLNYSKDRDGRYIQGGLKCELAGTGSTVGANTFALNTLIATGITAQFGYIPRINVITAPTTPVKTGARAGAFTSLEIKAVHRIMFYQRTADA